MPSAFPAGARHPRFGICGETDPARRFSGRRTLITGWMKAFGSLLLAVRETLVDLARCSAEVVAIRKASFPGGDAPIARRHCEKAGSFSDGSYSLGGLEGKAQQMSFLRSATTIPLFPTLHGRRQTDG